MMGWLVGEFCCTGKLLYGQALITRASTSFVTSSSYPYLVSVNCGA